VDEPPVDPAGTFAEFVVGVRAQRAQHERAEPVVADPADPVTGPGRAGHRAARSRRARRSPPAVVSRLSGDPTPTATAPMLDLATPVDTNVAVRLRPTTCG
jgi:hypothetical protein